MKRVQKKELRVGDYICYEYNIYGTAGTRYTWGIVKQLGLSSAIFEMKTTIDEITTYPKTVGKYNLGHDIYKLDVEEIEILKGEAL